jgi:hypothetical protein
MKPIAVLAALIAVAAAATAGGAGANGSPYSPGLDYGTLGVRERSGDVRYVTFGTPGDWTTIAAISTRGGRVVRSRVVRGFFGVPLVAYDGTTAGLSGDGRTLVLASYGPLPGEPGTTRFRAFRAKTLKQFRYIVLRGSWSFDALSPDGSRLYLVQHITAGPSPKYRVRVYDLAAGRLLPNAVIDRLVSKAIMGGQPATRVTTADGRWAYTLYARRKGKPFVHALDTARRKAFCIDLPLRLAESEQMRLRMRLRRDELTVRLDKAKLAAVDMRSFVVRLGGHHHG